MCAKRLLKCVCVRAGIFKVVTDHTCATSLDNLNTVEKSHGHPKKGSKKGSKKGLRLKSLAGSKRSFKRWLRRGSRRGSKRRFQKGIQKRIQKLIFVWRSRYQETLFFWKTYLFCHKEEPSLKVSFFVMSFFKYQSNFQNTTFLLVKIPISFSWVDLVSENNFKLDTSLGALLIRLGQISYRKYVDKLYNHNCSNFQHWALKFHCFSKGNNWNLTREMCLAPRISNLAAFLKATRKKSMAENNNKTKRAGNPQIRLLFLNCKFFQLNT